MESTRCFKKIFSKIIPLKEPIPAIKPVFYKRSSALGGASKQNALFSKNVH